VYKCAFYCRYLSIIFDAMDQSKCNVPHFKERPKEWQGCSQKLQMQYGAFIVHGHGTYGIAFDERVKKDGDLWTTSLLHIILDLYNEYKAKGRKWPERLYLQADNASDNKNMAMYALCQLLRDLGIFKVVKFCCLPVGHTHEDIDACFGALARQLNGQNILTMDQVEALWRKGWPSLKSFHLVTVIYYLIVCIFRASFLE